MLDSTTDADLLQTAHHEAGHALAAALLTVTPDLCVAAPRDRVYDARTFVVDRLRVINADTDHDFEAMYPEGVLGLTAWAQGHHPETLLRVLRHTGASSVVLDACRPDAFRSALVSLAGTEAQRLVMSPAEAVMAVGGDVDLAAALDALDTCYTNEFEYGLQSIAAQATARLLVHVLRKPIAALAAKVMEAAPCPVGADVITGVLHDWQSSSSSLDLVHQAVAETGRTGDSWVWFDVVGVPEPVDEDGESLVSLHRVVEVLPWLVAGIDIGEALDALDEGEPLHEVLAATA